MTQFNISLSPLLPWPLLVALAIGALAVTALGLYAGRRGTWLRAIGLLLILFALTDPSLVREDRQPLKDVVAVVIDESASQKIRERPIQTAAARKAIEEALGGMNNIEARIVTGGANDTDNSGTRLFNALSAALADVPPDRVGGAIIVTDGVVHDIPANADALGSVRRCMPSSRVSRVNATAYRTHRSAACFGLVGKPQTISLRVHDTANRGEPIDLIVRRDGTEISRQRAQAGATIKVDVRVEHAGQM